MAKRTAAFQVVTKKLILRKKGCADPIPMGMSRIDGKDALLAYRVWTDGKPMKYRIEVGNCRVSPHKYTRVDGDTVSNKKPIGLWRAFPTKVARTADCLRFRVTSGEGAIAFGDVVLWCMRN